MEQRGTEGCQREMSTSSRAETVSDLAFGIHATLSDASGSQIARSGSAARKLCRLRDALLDGEQLSSNDLTMLTAAGIRVSRRDDDDSQTHALLVFVNLCLAAAKRGSTGHHEESPEAFFGSLEKLLESPGIAEESEMAAWALARGIALLPTSTVDDLRPLARVFFLSSATMLQLRAFDCESDFLSLALHRPEGSITMDSIVAAADSEAGQVVLRDMYLSFILPMTLVGVRRTLLLTREAAHRATQAHPAETQAAHGLAMQGAVWVWQHSTDVTKRMCALLTGLACLLTREGPDPVRKGDAFGGRVSLPFLEPRPPTNKESVRLFLDRWQNRWVLFRLVQGAPDVMGSGVGMDGLSCCAGALLKDL